MFKKRPHEFYHVYKTKVMEKLNVVSSRQHWSYDEYARGMRGKFGRMTNMFRAYYHLHRTMDWLNHLLDTLDCGL